MSKKSNCFLFTGAFTYENGKTYRFSYETSVTSEPGVEQSSSSLYFLELFAEVSVLTPCNLQLAVELRNVTSHGTQVVSEDFMRIKTDFETHAVQFGFYNGRVGEVCSDPDETQFALNVKKGMLSAFQVTATTKDGFAQGTFLEVNSNAG